MNHSWEFSYSDFSDSILIKFSFITWSVRVAERLVLPTSVHGVAGSNPAGGEILPEPKRRFIAQSLSCSFFHRLEMTEILLKGRKTLTHPSIFYHLRFQMPWIMGRIIYYEVVGVTFRGGEGEGGGGRKLFMDCWGELKIKCLGGRGWYISSSIGGRGQMCSIGLCFH